MKEIRVEAKTENLDTVIAFLEEYLESLDASPKAGMQLAVALEEMYVNIARYAYEGTELPEEKRLADIVLETVGESEDKRLKITLTDWGIPYDPLEKEDPDTTLSAEERQIGGLGIFMVKKSMDALFYERQGDRNVFVMEKKL